MKHLLSLLLLLAAPVAGAVETVAPHPVLRMERELTAHVVGAEQPRSVQGIEFLVFDSYTGANYAFAGNSPRTFMGMPFNLAGAAGNDPMISKVVVYLAYTGTVAQTYSKLSARFQLWDAWSSFSTPVFSSPSALVVEAVASGPITLNPGSLTPITVTLGSPIPLSGLVKHGIAVNFQGDTGAGLASSDALTPVLRYGANPVAVGANPIPIGFGYRNGSGQTDFNFAPGNSETAQQMNQGLALQLYAVATPSAGPLVQDGGFEAGLVPTYWGQTSSNFTSPFCDASCGASPRTGTFFTWLGGTEAAEVSSVQQSGVIAPGPKILKFYVWWASSIDAPPDPGATFKVKIDGQTIFTLTPATAGAYSNAYTLASVDISTYADGNSHTLRFESRNAAAANPTNILLDDIGIDSVGLVQDGGFEAGLVPTYWEQASTKFGSPICFAACGADARTGAFFSWFGGADTDAEAASVQQSGVISAGPKTLDFYVWWMSSVVAPPDPDAYFRVKIDGNTIFTLTPATASAYSAAYTRASVDISAYADGNTHTLRFESYNAEASGPTHILLDDISIVPVDHIFASGFEPSGM